MRKPLYWLLGIIAILGIVAVAGAGILYFGLHTPVVQAAANLQVNLIPKLQSTSDRNTGLLVGAVAPGSPAEKAGIVRGDIILEVNGTAIQQGKGAGERGLLQNLKPGDAVMLKILHGDESKTVSVTLADQNGNPYIGISPAFTSRGGMLGMFGKGQNGPNKPRILPAGALVVEVTKDGPADKAEVKVGDVIVKINDTPINADNDLVKVIQAFKPGESVKVSVLRKGQADNPADLQVTLGSNPGNANQAFLGVRFQMLPIPLPAQPNIVPPGGPNNNGQGSPNLPPIPNQPFRRLPNAGIAGLVVNSVIPGSPAEKAGLKVGDVITQANGKPVTTPVDFANQVRAAKPGDQLVLTVNRNRDQANPLTITATLAANPDNSGTTFLGVITTNEAFRGIPPDILPQNKSPQKPGENT